MQPDSIILHLIARLEAERLAAEHRAQRAEQLLEQARAEIERLKQPATPAF